MESNRWLAVAVDSIACPRWHVSRQFGWRSKDTIGIISAIVLATWIVAGACADAQSFAVKNPLNAERPNAIFVGPAALVGFPPFAPGAYSGWSEDGQRLAIQLDDLDGDGEADQLTTVLNLKPEEEKRVTIRRRTSPARAYEGPSFADARPSWRFERYAVLETDRIAYGLYGIYAPQESRTLAWDCYGKRPEAWRLSLDQLASVNYHKDNPVAVDFLPMKKTLGLGGPFIGLARPMHGRDGCRYAYRVLARGPVRAGLEVKVARWRARAAGSYDAIVRYWVYAHHDFIDAEYTLLPAKGRPKTDPPSMDEPRKTRDEYFGAGIRKISDASPLLASRVDGILAAWGQLPNITGETGLGLIFDPEDFVAWHNFSDDSNAHGVFLGPNLVGQERVRVRMRLVGVWSEGGMAGAKTFATHLKDLALRFQSPVTEK